MTKITRGVFFDRLTRAMRQLGRDPAVDHRKLARDFQLPQTSAVLVVIGAGARRSPPTTLQEVGDFVTAMETAWDSREESTIPNAI